MRKNVETEAVEICPHCDAENVFPNYDVKKNGYIATCEYCGEKMFLCDECLHADDNENGNCDWHEEKGYSCCFRGRYKMPKGNVK